MSIHASTLVTGGAGFIGSHVTDNLIRAGHKVIVLDDLSGGFMENVNPEATYIQGSITDRECLENIFHNHRIEYIFHTAAYAAEGLSHFIRHFNYTNNLIGSINLINYAIKARCKCFVFTSSIAVYGHEQIPMHESMTPQPEDPYGISKYAVELDLAAAHKMFGLNYIIFRPHNVYGERQNIGDPYRNVVGIFMNQILKGQSCTIFGDGTQTRAFTHIDDVAGIIAKSINLAAAYNQIFNVGADRPHTVNELAHKVQVAMGREDDVIHLPARAEVLHAFSIHSKIKNIFDIPHGVELEDGLWRMAAWAKKKGPQQGHKFEKIEIEKGIPESWGRL